MLNYLVTRLFIGLFIGYYGHRTLQKYILPWFWRREEQFEQRLQTFQATIQQMREETGEAGRSTAT